MATAEPSNPLHFSGTYNRIGASLSTTDNVMPYSRPPVTSLPVVDHGAARLNHFRFDNSTYDTALSTLPQPAEQDSETWIYQRMHA
jgi:hypothetical protein